VVDRPDHDAAFFFLGSFQPAEIANFNLQNVFLPGEKDAVLEVLGHGASIWWKRRRRRDFDLLRDDSRDWLETIASAYFLERGIALDVHLHNWVETLTHTDEAVVGFIDPRFRVIPSALADSEVSQALREAVRLAGRIRGREHLQPAVKEVWRAALDPSDEALLSAFWGLECVRRLYGEDGEAEEIKAAWKAMQADLTAEREPFDVLREAAMAIRHGNRPAPDSNDHPVRKARQRREELLAYATRLVGLCVEARI
jgi:hypothetical protein